MNIPELPDTSSSIGDLCGTTGLSNLARSAFQIAEKRNCPIQTNDKTYLNNILIILSGTSGTRGQLDFTELSAFHVQNLRWY